MADFDREIGGQTRLRIREGPEPSQFQFFVQTGSQTFNYQQPWSWGLRQDYGPGFNSQRLQFRMEKGGAWQYMGMIEDMGDLTKGIIEVRLSIHNAGLGFPDYDFIITLDRSGPPPPPGPPVVWTYGDTWVEIGWGGDGGPGGASIVGREFWWSYDGVPRNLIANGGARYRLEGLIPGNTYHIWAKNANAKGWSDFGAPTIVRTRRVPDAPHQVTFPEVTQVSVRTAYHYDGRWDGGTPVREWQIGYGQNPAYPQSFKTGVHEFIGSLAPGQRYYFWARGRNDVGWGFWSSRAEVLLLAGAYVNQAGVSRRALVWIKVNGVWRLTRPWVKSGKNWRTTK
jgi:hypothetical protein